MSTFTSFSDLGLSTPVLEALSIKGFEEPTPIQALVIPALLKAQTDIIGQAQTGTGKTAAFALPLLELLLPSAGYVQALVLAPTRELALQITEEIFSLKRGKPLSVAPVYGGQPYTEQLRRFRQGVDLIVGTPGRVLDHLERGNLKLDRVKFVILDEADEMLDMGFQEDIETVLGKVNPERRMLMFSATMPDRIRKIADKHMKNPLILSVKSATLTTDLTKQIYFEVTENDKFEVLCRILDLEETFYGMVFCRTKLQTDDLSRRLSDRGYACEALHGDLTQSQRENVLRKFKENRINVLCATDVAARGIDIDSLTHVINYSLPQNPEAYVHRIGRTGRAGKEGTAVTLITSEEHRKLAFIERVSKSQIHKKRVPEVSEIILLKKKRLLAKVQSSLQQKTLPIIKQLSQELLENRAAEEVLAAVLQFYSSGVFDENAYAPIRDLFDRVKREHKDHLGSLKTKSRNKYSFEPRTKARLFVALGRREGWSIKKLIKFFETEGKISGRLIDDTVVLDEFSFVTVPLSKAEHLVRLFRAKGPYGKPLVKLARSEGSDNLHIGHL